MKNLRGTNKYHNVRWELSIAFTLLVLSTLPVNAITLTGEDIFNDPNNDFPTAARSTSLSGSSLIFGPGVNNFEILVEIPLVSAGTYSSGDPQSHVTITANLTRLAADIVSYPADYDPIFMLYDGSKTVGFVALENNNGEGHTDTGNRNGNLVQQTTFSPALFSNVGFPSIGGNLTVMVDFFLDDALTRVAGSFGTGTGSTDYTGSQALDRTQALSLLLVADNNHEQIRIDSLFLDVAAVPEPSSFMLFSTGLIGLFGYGRQRKKIVRGVG